MRYCHPFSSLAFFLCRSKALLLVCVDSDSIRRILNARLDVDSKVNNVNRVLEFLRERVFTHEDKFARYLYVNRLCFNEYSNTCIEGTNSGMKHCENSVRPSMRVDKTTRVTVCQDLEKARTTKWANANERHKQPVAQKTSTSNRLTQLGEGMLRNEKKLASSYVSTRSTSEPLTWYVLYSGARAGVEPGEKLRPVFIRVRKVWVCNGHLHCDCYLRMEMGIGWCRHIFHVVIHYTLVFCESSLHHGVDLRFWSSYNYYMLQDPSVMVKEELAIRARLMKARAEGLCVVAPEEWTDAATACGVDSQQDFKDLSPEELTSRIEDCQRSRKLANYSEDNIRRALSALKICPVAGMTQETYHCTEWKEDSVDDAVDDGYSDFEVNTALALANTAETTGSGFFQRMNPIWKEAADVMEENYDPNLEARFRALMDEMMARGDSNSSAKKRPPPGSIVSCKVPLSTNRHKHKKQRPFGA